MFDGSSKEIARKTTAYIYDNNGNQLKQSISHTLPNNTQLRPSIKGTAYGATVAGSIDTLLEKTSYTYDGFNRLKKAETIKGGNRTTAEYIYNGDDLRVSKTVKKSDSGYTAEVTNYQYDRQNVILETDASSSIKARYIKGINYIASTSYQNNQPNETYFLYNGHGDVVQTVDEAGTIQNQYDYDIWGNPTLTVETTPNAIRYAGEFFDNETGLYYLRARYYDPYTGRFTTEDSYWGEEDNPLSLNRYTYCENDPIQYVDPTGHYVSDWDRDNLSSDAITQLENCGAAYNIAKSNNDKEGMDAAHDAAEKIRDGSGLRGGNVQGTADGNTVIVDSSGNSTVYTSNNNSEQRQQEIRQTLTRETEIVEAYKATNNWSMPLLLNEFMDAMASQPTFTESGNGFFVNDDNGFSTENWNGIFTGYWNDSENPIDITLISSANKETVTIAGETVPLYKDKKGTYIFMYNLNTGARQKVYFDKSEGAKKGIEQLLKYGCSVSPLPISMIPTKLKDGTLITSSNKENQVTYDYFMKYVYKTGLGYDSEIPYTSYTAWIRDTYGKNGIENFWNTAQNIVYNTEDPLASLQNLLDYGGMIPVFGEPLDGINAVIYFVRGDKVNAALSAGAIVPFIGNGVTGVKIAKKSANAVDNALDVAKKAAKTIQVPGRVQSRINLRNGSAAEGAGFNHVLDRHFNPSKNASQFSVTPDELKTILQSKEVVSTPVSRVLQAEVKLPDGTKVIQDRYLREVTLNSNIGIDKFSNSPTNIMTVLTDKFGNLVTATPGVIK